MYICRIVPMVEAFISLSYLLLYFFILIHFVLFTCSQQQNLSGGNLLGMLNQPQFAQPDLALSNTLLNNAPQGTFLNLYNFIVCRSSRVSYSTNVTGQMHVPINNFSIEKKTQTC